MDAPASEETPDQAAQYIASLTQELTEIARRAFPAPSSPSVPASVDFVAILEAIGRSHGPVNPLRRSTSRFCLSVALLPHPILMIDFM